MAEKSKRTAGRSAQGVALTLALFVMLMLTLLGFGVIAASRSATRVSNGFQSQKIAFEAAEAGIEYGREQLRANRSGGTTFTQMLTTARNGGTLVNAVSLSNFLGSTGSTNATTNTPFVTSRAVGSGTFQVFLTNDRAEGVTTATDSNNRVMLTSFGSGPTGVGFAVVQAEMRIALADLPQLPGVITLPGPSVDFNPFNSNAHNIDGDDGSSTRCYSTIAVTSATSLAEVDTAITKRASRYTTCSPIGGVNLTGAATVENFVANDPLAPSNPYEPAVLNVPSLVAGNPNLTSVSYLQNLVAEITAVADFTSTSDPGFTLGTVANPKVVVIHGDYTAGSGAGVLVVTGNLTFSGNPSYTGTVLAIGAGSVTINGGGNGTFTGSMLIANTNVPWDAQGRYVGIPSYTDNGGGSASQDYDSVAGQGFLVRYSLPLDAIAYQQLR